MQLSTLYRATLCCALGFTLLPAAAGEEYQELFHFQKGSGHILPLSSVLAVDSAGNVFGVTQFGPLGNDRGSGQPCYPTYGCGTVFELQRIGVSGTYGFGTRYQFTDQLIDGAFPQGALAFDRHGNLYGTTLGGPNSGHNGTVYRLVPDGSGGWNEELVWNLKNGSHGQAPNGVVVNAAGEIYTTTQSGGPSGLGTAFAVARNSLGEWVSKTVHVFAGGVDGAMPKGGLIFDSQSNLYGTTSAGGVMNQGTVFKLAPNPDGTWAETVLYSFEGSPDGCAPQSNLVFDDAGNLYGAAKCGIDGGGVIFRLSPAGAGWTETIIHTFHPTVSHPGEVIGPLGPLVVGNNGSIYGAAAFGGRHPNSSGGEPGAGGIFKLTPDGSGGFTESQVKVFDIHAPFGAYPGAGLLKDSMGNIFGTTTSDAYGSMGVIFEITP